MSRPMHATARKTTTLELRIDPAIKETLRLAVAGEHRSIANFIEIMARDQPERAGLPYQGRRPGDEHG
jgi:hypothetical protein